MDKICSWLLDQASSMFGPEVAFYVVVGGLVVLLLVSWINFYKRQDSPSAPVQNVTGKVEGTAINGGVSGDVHNEIVHGDKIVNHPVEIRQEHPLDIANRYIDEINRMFAPNIEDVRRIRGMFGFVRAALIAADAEQSQDGAKSMLFAGRYRGCYGDFISALNTLIRSTDAYTAAMRAYYERCKVEAMTKECEPEAVQKEIWKGLSSDARMVIVLTGVIHEKVDYNDRGAYGGVTEYYSVLGAIPVSKHFNVARTLFRFLSEGYRGLDKIWNEEHIR